MKVAAVAMEASELLLRSESEIALLAEPIFQHSALRWLAAEPGSLESQAVARLASILSSKYNDSWLADAVTERPRHARLAGLLFEASQENGRGDPDAALKVTGAVQLQSAMGKLMEFERVYAYHRSFHGEQECLNHARADLRAIGNRYPWLRNQLKIEASVCAAISGHEGEGLRALRSVVLELADSPYRELRMRAIGIRANIQTNAGDPWVSWPTADAVMSEYWQGPYSGARAHQVLFNESHACDHLGWPHASALLVREAVDALSDTDYRSLEAIGLSHLAALDLAVGWHDDAEAAIGRARRLFNNMTDSKTRRLYQADAEIALASARIAAGDVRTAVDQLQESQRLYDRLPTFLLDMRRSALLGRAYTALGYRELAERQLRQGIDGVWNRVSSLNGRQERAAALEEATGLFRNLTALNLEGGRDSDAYLLWRSFLEGNQMKTDVAPREATRGLGLVYLAWADSYYGWLVRAGVPVRFNVKASARQIDRSAGRLLEQAARRDGDTRELRNEARWLYSQLIGPIAEHIERNQPIRIAPDGALAVLPFALLETPEGELLGDSNPLSDGVTERVHPSPLLGMKSALVIGAPYAGTGLEARFPFLTDGADEAEAIASRIHGSITLRGKQATLDRLAHWKDMPELFHFAGHGYSNAGHGALVMASDSDTTDPSLLTAERIASFDFAHCRLVVLSACMTATGTGRGPSDPSSLVRAFLMSGAQEVVASRWSVDSTATRRLMNYFYDELARGAETSDALRIATKRVRNERDYSHPYYWAAFQVFQ